MLRLRFPSGEPPDVRLVLSPLWEALASIRVLHGLPVHEIHRDWAETTTHRLVRHRSRLEMLFALVRPGVPYTPGFLFVPPVTPVPDLTADLAGLRGTSPAQVRSDLDLYSWVLTTQGAAGVPTGPAPGPGPLPGALTDLYDDPAAGLVELAQQISLYWKLAIAPRWGRIRAFLSNDLIERGRLPGPKELLTGLHPAVSWRGRVLTIEDSGASGSRDLQRSELLLMPSAFVWPGPTAAVVPPYQPRLAYPARGVQTLWSRPGPAPIAELAGVLGASRARLLAELAVPASTSDLAARTDITAGGASQHLAALRAAGLVSSHRSGHSVLYARTAAAEALLASAAATSPRRAE